VSYKKIANHFFEVAYFSKLVQEHKYEAMKNCILPQNQA